VIYQGQQDCENIWEMTNPTFFLYWCFKYGGSFSWAWGIQSQTNEIVSEKTPLERHWPCVSQSSYTCTHTHTHTCL